MLTSDYDVVICAVFLPKSLVSQRELDPNVGWGVLRVWLEEGCHVTHVLGERTRVKTLPMIYTWSAMCGFHHQEQTLMLLRGALDEHHVRAVSPGSIKFLVT